MNTLLSFMDPPDSPELLNSTGSGAVSAGGVASVRDSAFLSPLLPSSPPLSSNRVKSGVESDGNVVGSLEARAFPGSGT